MEVTSVAETCNLRSSLWCSWRIKVFLDVKCQLVKINRNFDGV